MPPSVGVAITAIPMKTITTALRLLEAFNEGSERKTVRELAERFGLPKSQVSRMLGSFRDAGWLEQDPRSRSYAVGLSAYVFGARFVQFHPLTRQAFPVLRGVVDRSGFNTTLSVLDHLKPLYLLGIAGSVPVDLASNFGSYFPFHATAAGKVLAAYTDEATREKMLQTAPFERVTSRTIVVPCELADELKLVFRRGYATSDGERVPGIGAMAVPVIGRDGELVAALGIAYPSKMVLRDDYEYQAAILKSGAHTLAERLNGAQRKL
ncbi:DNA-binding IclR family transcriptional regulator [Paraburkholderia sp. RAU6.4a]|uniref:IclR family transcriptional regulator n=1 Tax=Paraburkholderia sp. RAU6.4a TaxID=2991067 RepID=UPI003D21957B